MTTHVPVKTGPEHVGDIQEKIRELRELFADAPEIGKNVLETVLRELTSQRRSSGAFGRQRETPVRAGQRHGAAQWLDDGGPARVERMAVGAGIVARSHTRSRQVFTKPEVIPIVLVADDDVAIRESLEVLIKCEGWHPELFVSAQEFLARPKPTVPCCLILDVRLPGLDGHKLHEHLGDRHDMPIVFIGNCADVPLSVQAMKAGGVEFLTKPLRHDVLLRVLRDAVERSRETLRLDLELQALANCYDSLTHREREVMALVVSGLLNKQVGGELGIREITVKIHRSQVMRKMKAESLPDLVMMAARLGLRPERRPQN